MDGNRLMGLQASKNKREEACFSNFSSPKAPKVRHIILCYADIKALG